MTDWSSPGAIDRVCGRIVSEALDGFVVADREGVIRIWNRGAERIFGRPASEALGRSLDLIVPEKHRADHWEGFRRVMGTGVTKYGAETLGVPAVRADGTRISIEFTVVLLPGEGVLPEGVAAIVRDVTARRAQEKELKKRLAELENPSPGGK